MMLNKRAMALLALLLTGHVNAQSQAATPIRPVPGAAQQRARWDALTTAERADLRARYAAWKSLTATERVVLRQARAQLLALPEQQQRALETEFLRMDRLQRAGWHLGPQIGSYYPQLQPLVGYVPAGQRDRLLAVLRGLDAGQLQQLAVLAQRTAPQQRQALREGLLAQPAATRGQWLDRQLTR